VAEEPALDAHRGPADAERQQQVEDDVVVVAGIERDAVDRLRLDEAADDVERVVAVEGGGLDGDSISLKRRQKREPSTIPPTAGWR
jgi:hypothetical protein